jgi:hypothetical protein
METFLGLIRKGMEKGAYCRNYLHRVDDFLPKVQHIFWNKGIERRSMGRDKESKIPAICNEAKNQKRHER